MKAIIESTLTKVSTVSGFEYVDENWGQLDPEATSPDMEWPCALVDVTSITYTNIGTDQSLTPKNRQMGEFNLEIRVANLRSTETPLEAPSIWDLIQEVHENMQGFEPAEMCGKLIRTGQSRIDREDGIQEYVILYKGNVQNV